MPRLGQDTREHPGDDLLTAAGGCAAYRLLEGTGVVPEDLGAVGRATTLGAGRAPGALEHPLAAD